MKLYQKLTGSLLVLTLPTGLFIGVVSIFVARQHSAHWSFFSGALFGALVGIVVGLALDWLVRQNAYGWLAAAWVSVAKWL